MLKDTLVIIGGEFGRTPAVEVSGLIKVQNGRDHNNQGFSYVLAGGGVKGGMAYGATDEFGFKAVENPVHIHDLHATVLHLMGLEHTRVDIPLQRARFPPDGCGGDCGQGHYGLGLARREPYCGETIALEGDNASDCGPMLDSDRYRSIGFQGNRRV